MVLVAKARSASPEGTAVTSLHYTPDGKTLIASSLDGFIVFWDAAKKAERARIEAHKNGIYGLAVSEDGALLATAGGDRLVRVWDVRKLKEIQRLEGHKDKVVAVAFSPDGKTLASAGYDRSVRLWDWAAGKELHKLEGHEFRATCVAFSPDGKMLASGGIAKAELPNFRGSTQADHIRLWHPATGTLTQLPIRGHNLALSPDGRTLVAAGMYLNFLPTKGGFTIDGGSRISLWDLVRNKERFKIEEYWHAIALSADGQFLASGWGNTLHMGGMVLKGSKGRGIHLWETATGREVLQIAVAQDRATVLAICPDGKMLAAGLQNGQVDFWDLAPPDWKAKATSFDDQQMQKLWTNLGDKDSKLAYEAIWTLASTPDKTVAFLEAHLTPAPPLKAPLSRLVSDLDSKEFAVRENASKESAKLGSSAEPLLRRTLNNKPSPELRRRVTALLEQLPDRVLQPDELQRSRALHLLEQIGNQAALDFLKKLAQGHRESPQTEQSQAAILRLQRRSPNN